MVGGDAPQLGVHLGLLGLELLDREEHDPGDAAEQSEHGVELLPDQLLVPAVVVAD